MWWCVCECERVLSSHFHFYYFWLLFSWMYIWKGLVTKKIITSANETRRRLFFQPCLFVCLSVCLARKYLKKLLWDFNVIFGKGVLWGKEYLVRFSGRSKSRFGFTDFLFVCLSVRPQNIWKKLLTDFSIILRKSVLWGKEQMLRFYGRSGWARASGSRIIFFILL